MRGKISYKVIGNTYQESYQKKSTQGKRVEEEEKNVRNIL
jgi:hypothetical protein